MAKSRESKGKNRICIVVSAALLIVSAVLLLSARLSGVFANWYSRSIYQLAVGTIGRLSGILPFSLAEMLVLVLPAVLIVDAVYSRKQISAFLRRLILFLSVLVFLYSANCGVNYYKDPFVSQQVYSDSSFTTEQLADFCEYAADQLRSCPGKSDDGSFTYPDKSTLASDAVAAMRKLGKEYESLSGYYPYPKSLSFLSGFFSGMGVSGIYSPFTVEANINGEMPGMEQPFTACHELSHLRGFMNEGEANYIGWLACIGSDDAAFRRSGWLIAWNYAGSALYRTDPDRYMEVLSDLPEAARIELQHNHDFWESHETKASEVQDRVNDAYLKSNGQEDGISSYGKLTTLMLVWYLSNGISD